jgi:hypothetical protein
MDSGVVNDEMEGGTSIRAADQPRQSGVRFRRTARISVWGAFFVLRHLYEETRRFDCFGFVGA